MKHGTAMFLCVCVVVTPVIGAQLELFINKKNPAMFFHLYKQNINFVMCFTKFGLWGTDG